MKIAAAKSAKMFQDYAGFGRQDQLSAMPGAQEGRLPTSLALQIITMVSICFWALIISLIYFAFR